MCVIAILSQCDCKIGKSAIAKKRSMPQKKEGAQKHYRSWFTNSIKKGRKVATSQERVFSDCHA
jgi:hypothetical protein